jgi:hypothetical protein
MPRADAAPLRVKAKPKRKARRVTPPAGDIARSGGDYGTRDATAFKKTPAYRKAVRDTYTEQPIAKRRAILKHAAGQDARTVHHEHQSRLARNRALERARAQHDILTAADAAAARAFNKAHPVKPDKDGGLLASIANIAPAAIPGVPGVLAAIEEATGAKTFTTAKKIAGNVPRDAAELVITTPSSLAKLATTAVHDPEKVPGMLAEPYKQLARDPGKFITEKPVSTLLMVAPAARVPTRAAGKAARLAGKQTLARPAKTLPGTRCANATPAAATSSYAPSKHARTATRARGR